MIPPNSVFVFFNASISVFFSAYSYRRRSCLQRRSNNAEVWRTCPKIADQILDMGGHDNAFRNRHPGRSDESVQNFVHGISSGFRCNIPGTSLHPSLLQDLLLILLIELRYLVAAFVGHLAQNDVRILVGCDHHLHDNTSHDLYVPVRFHRRAVGENRRR